MGATARGPADGPGLTRSGAGAAGGPGNAFQRMLRLGFRDHVHTVRAVLVLVVVEVGLRTMPLPRLTRLLGVELDLDEPRPTATAPSSRIAALRTGPESRAVRRVMRYRPSDAGPCLRKSLVLARMLRRQGAVVRLGIARAGDRRLCAHAWVDVGGTALDGAQPFLPFTRQPSDAST